jgi:hypothetical protein
MTLDKEDEDETVRGTAFREFSLDSGLLIFERDKNEGNDGVCGRAEEKFIKDPDNVVCEVTNEEEPTSEEVKPEGCGESFGNFIYEEPRILSKKKYKRIKKSINLLNLLEQMVTLKKQNLK